jgi:autotransporter passenger strand-loop-strand repeat protein
MSGTRITGVVSTSVTLGNIGYVGPLTITSTGAIYPTNSGDTALFIPAKTSNATVVNNGLIHGGNGYGSNYGGYGGGIGVSVATAAVISNSGKIFGGEGGSGGFQNAYQGGSGGGGVSLTSGSALENSGSIFGGDGGDAYFGASGGVGISVTASSITSNTGVIHGGNGGGGHNGGNGGYGVLLTSGIVVNNAGGSIIGGNGGAGSSQDGDGAVGVFLNGGTLMTAGTIAGGVDGDYGHSSPSPTSAGAVQFGAMVGTLVVEQGAVFDGIVSANANVADVLEVAGTSSAALTGIGDGAFYGFKNISFGSGAAWTIEGSTLGLTAGETIAGFAAGDSIILDGFSETSVSYGSFGLDLSAGGTVETLDIASTLTGNLLVTNNGTNSTIASKLTATGVTLTAGDEDYVLKGGKATKFTVNSKAGVSVAKGGSLTSSTINNGGLASVAAGGSITNVTVADKGKVTVIGVATGTDVKSGGLELVSLGGTASNTVLQGGTLEAVNSGNITGSVTFKGSGGVLVLNQTKMPTAKISGFASGDKIELLSAAAASGTVSVAKAGVVTVSAGGKSYSLNIAGAKVGETDFKFSNHTLTEMAAAKMAFQRPDEAVTPTTVPAMAEVGWHQVFTGWTPAPLAPTASAIAPGGLAYELLRVPHGGVQTMATLLGRGGFIPGS